MTSRDQGLFAVMAVVAIVAVIVAAAAVAFALVRTQREHRRIVQLESQVQTLCQRRMVTGVKALRLGHVTVQTARGC